jgi:hypothetical protein
LWPKAAAALRIAARSASSGTPVKSCSTTRATMNGISSTRSAFGCQLASWRTCSSVTFLPSQLRSTDSSTMRSDTGSRATLGYSRASSGSEHNAPRSCVPMRNDCRVAANGLTVVMALLPSGVSR